MGTWACSVDLLIQKVILADIYKAVNNIGASYLQDLFNFSQNSTRHKDRDLVLSRVDSITYGIHSLRYHGPKLWAAMPHEAKQPPIWMLLKLPLFHSKALNANVPCVNKTIWSHTVLSSLIKSSCF